MFFDSYNFIVGQSGAYVFPVSNFRDSFPKGFDELTRIAFTSEAYENFQKLKKSLQAFPENFNYIIVS